MIEWLCGLEVNIGVAFIAVIAIGMMIAALIYGAGCIIAQLIRDARDAKEEQAETDDQPEPAPAVWEYEEWENILKEATT